MYPLKLTASCLALIITSAACSSSPAASFCSATPSGSATSTSPSSSPSHTFNVTAISASNGLSTLECWSLLFPSSISSQPGTQGTVLQTLGATGNATYTTLSANFYPGAHSAPTLQYVAFLSGLAHVTVPSSSKGTTHTGSGTSNPNSVYILGGRNGLIIAADTKDVSPEGHVTEYPGDEPTTILEIPIVGGIPPRRVLHSGPCTASEMSGN